MQEPWCVAWIMRDENGRVVSMIYQEWCMLASQPKNAPPRYRDNMKTACDHWVTLPGGMERREPTCPECLAKLRRKQAAVAEPVDAPDSKSGGRKPMGVRPSPAVH